MRRVGFILILLPGLTIGMAAQQPEAVARPALGSAQALTCSFTAYAAGDWRDGKPEMTTATEAFGFEVQAIDLKKRSARIVGTRGAAEASVFLTATGLTVIEQTALGNFILTTVFQAGAAGPGLLAVHSRHIGDPQALPSSSQHYGLCEIVR